MKVYIAGPMTGLPEYNYPAFHSAAAELRGRGYEVESPAEHDHGTDMPWDFYVRLGLVKLLDCDAVVLLPGWENSRGARLEWYVASRLQMRCVDWPDLPYDSQLEAPRGT